MSAFGGLLDPTGASGQAGPVTSLTARPKDLTGLKVGLLDNTKPNAGALLAELGRELQARFGAGETRTYVKDYFGTPMDDELRDRIVAECDIVVTAVGDCGSCSAATVADGLILERAGTPAVSVCSDSFMRAGRAMASVQGFKDYEFVEVRHPVASLNAEQLRARALEVMPKVAAILGLDG